MIKRKLAAEEIQKMKDGYIPAPYQLEEGEQINDVYLEPCLLYTSDAADE